MKPIYLSQWDGPFQVGDRVYEDIDELMVDIEPELMSLTGLPEVAIAHVKEPFYVPSVKDFKTSFYDEYAAWSAWWVHDSYFSDYIFHHDWAGYEPDPSANYRKISQQLEDSVGTWKEINRGIIALNKWLDQNKPNVLKSLGRDTLPTLCDWILENALAKFKDEAVQEYWWYKSTKQEIILEYPGDWIVEMARRTQPKPTTEDVPEHLRRYLRPETRASLTQ